MADSSSIIALHQELDTLWIRYLDFLDQYTQAHTVIKTSLGQGFFSLAQANFTSSGRRYGQDHYDQRAVASTKVQILDEDSETLRVKIAAIDIEAKRTVIPEPENVEPEGEATQLPTPEPEVPEVKADIKKEATQLPTPEPEDQHQPKEKVEDDAFRLPTDPLRQFGILIPPALRAAQKSFAKAVRDEDALAKAVNAARGMREVEVEIRKCRKVLRKAEREAGSGVVEG